LTNGLTHDSVVENVWLGWEMVLLRWESLSGKCAKLHTVAVSNKGDPAPQYFAYASHFVQSSTI